LTLTLFIQRLQTSFLNFVTFLNVSKPFLHILNVFYIYG